MSVNPSQTRVRASAVCLVNEKVLMVRLRDPKSGVSRLFPPGGKIEDGETPLQTAIRETWEETGFALKASPSSQTRQNEVCVSYPYDWSGTSYEVTTYFILCELDEPFREPTWVQDVEYNLGAVWVPREQISDVLAFNPFIQKGVLDCLALA